MDFAEVLAFMALVGALMSIWSGVLIAQDLQARGYPAKPILVRWMIFRYMAEYRRITRQETGTVGPLHQRCATTCGITALLAVAAILARLLA
jgi:hypothetical protein